MKRNPMKLLISACHLILVLEYHVQRYCCVVRSRFLTTTKSSIRWKLITGDKLYSNLNSFALPELVSGPMGISLHV
jgi:hypothetical protein